MPPREPRVLLLHSISAKGIPQGNEGKPGAITSDPYCRFLLMDNLPTATGYSKTAKKQVAFTSYMQNQDCPEWDGHLPQHLTLTLTLHPNPSP